MAAQPESLQVIQFEVESTAGTIVAADKKFFGLRGSLTPQRNVEAVLQAGNRHPVGHVPLKGMETLALTGQPNVEDIIYLLAAGLINPTFSNPGTLAYLATFAPSSIAGNTRKTLSFEKGMAGSGNADKFGYGTLVDFGLDIVPDRSIGVSATIIGQKRTTGVTLTSSPVTLDNSLLFGNAVNVYLATSEAGLSAGQIKPLSVKFNISKLQGPIMTVSDDASFTEIIETDPEITVELVFPKGSATNGYLAAIDAGTVYYLEIRMRGALIETVTATDYYNELKIRLPFNFINPGEGTDQEAHTATFIGRAVHVDDFNTTGGAIKVTAQSILQAL